MAFCLYGLAEKFCNAFFFAITCKQEMYKQRKTIITVVSEAAQFETKGFLHIQPHQSDYWACKMEHENET